MMGTRAITVESCEMLSGSVTLMPSESVVRIFGIELKHVPIPSFLCENTGGGNCLGKVVSADDWHLRYIGTWDSSRIHK